MCKNKVYKSRNQKALNGLCNKTDSGHSGHDHFLQGNEETKGSHFGVSHAFFSWKVSVCAEMFCGFRNFCGPGAIH